MDKWVHANPGCFVSQLQVTALFGKAHSKASALRMLTRIAHAGVCGQWMEM